MYKAEANRWTPEEVAILRYGTTQGLKLSQMVALLPGRSKEQIHGKRTALGLRKYTVKRFTAEEDAIIKREWDVFTPVHEFVRLLQPGRTIGVVRQRIRHLGLKRDGRRTRLAAQFGKEALAIEGTTDQVRLKFKEQQQQENEAARVRHLEEIMDALDIAEKTVSEGGSRREAFQAAMLAGATLQQVGDRFDITRERVRQIVHKVVPTYKRLGLPNPQYKKAEPTEKACEQCAKPFMAKSKKKRFCPDCSSQRIRSKAEAFWASKKATNVYAANEYRANRLVDKFNGLPPAFQQMVLAKITPPPMVLGYEAMTNFLPPEFAKPNEEPNASQNPDNGQSEPGSDPIKKDAH